MTPYSSSSETSRGSARVSSMTSSSEYSAPLDGAVTDGLRLRRAAPVPATGPSLAGRDVVARAARGELLADDAQRQELVALQAQDRAQALHVAAGVEPVAARRAARRQQLLILQIADLRDRDVRELLLERLADGADRHRLARRAGLGVGLDLGGDGFRFVLDGHERHCERKVSLNLPTCSSSPSSRRWDSMR